MSPYGSLPIALEAEPNDAEGADRDVAAGEHPVAGARSYQRLAAAIIGLIEQGEVKVGDRLPAERALAERFMVSRPAIREAIIALEIRGIVEVRGGSGIYVCGIRPSQFLNDAAPGPFELLGARLVVEPEICAVAATSLKDPDLDKIYAALGELRLTMNDKRANEAADRKFHVTIAEATGNTVLVHMVTSVWDKARGAMWVKLEEHFHTPALRDASMQDHQRIFSALVARDSEQARMAMRMHIQRVMKEFGQAWRGTDDL